MFALASVFIVFTIIAIRYYVPYNRLAEASIAHSFKHEGISVEGPTHTMTFEEITAYTKKRQQSF